MNISLVPELEKFVQTRIDCGAYSSADEMFSEALRLLKDSEDKRRQAMDAFIDEALQDDRLYSPSEVWAELEQIIVEAESKNV